MRERSGGREKKRKWVRGRDGGRWSKDRRA